MATEFALGHHQDRQQNERAAQQGDGCQRLVQPPARQHGTVTTGSSVDSIAAFVGPMRFSPARKATTGSRVVITTNPAMATTRAGCR